MQNDECRMMDAEARSQSGLTLLPDSAFIVQHSAFLQDVQSRAVDDERGAVDEAGFAGGEEGDRSREVGGLADCAFDLFLAALDVRVVPEHRRVDRAGRDAVDANLPRL